MNHMPDDNCPKCSKFINAATAVEGDSRPEPGDVTVCIGCSGMLQYDSNMKLKELSLQELASMDDEARTELLKAVAIVQSMMRR